PVTTASRWRVAIYRRRQTQLVAAGRMASRDVPGLSSEWNIVVGTGAAAVATAAARKVIGLGRRRRVGLATRTVTLAAAEELDVVRDDLGDVSLVAFLVVVVARLDPTLDVDLASLREVLRADLRALAPHDDSMPLGALLALPVLVVPALARCHAELAHALTARGVPHVGV